MVFDFRFKYCWACIPHTERASPIMSFECIECDQRQQVIKVGKYLIASTNVLILCRFYNCSEHKILTCLISFIINFLIGFLIDGWIISLFSSLRMLKFYKYGIPRIHPDFPFKSFHVLYTYASLNITHCAITDYNRRS